MYIEIILTMQCVALDIEIIMNYIRQIDNNGFCQWTNVDTF